MQINEQFHLPHPREDSLFVVPVRFIDRTIMWWLLLPFLIASPAQVYLDLLPPPDFVQAAIIVAGDTVLSGIVWCWSTRAPKLYAEISRSGVEFFGSNAALRCFRSVFHEWHEIAEFQPDKLLFKGNNGEILANMTYIRGFHDDFQQAFAKAVQEAMADARSRISPQNRSPDQAG